MWQYVVKILVTAVVVVAVSELAKRESIWAALLASLPLTSLLAFVWLHIETRDAARIADLSQGIFWLVLPSLLLFVLLPVLLKAGWSFWPSLLVSGAATAAGYAAVLWLFPGSGLRS
jgi:hypothetical protein